ncbi:nucleotide pyrophosphohydrolase, putative [Babesia ovata]|uniref:Nucleotide pyrophosphohydrolase, putative n=1 Tax=Babesia ovata TaxID=189622 RepID=A0A2H6KAD7_9APIC|nr:nucleotide pyrophosphohydrolase, putative [Babesia ovata]GBE59953.1 nucleotide pyrophosphohydrolase, putative [Babesia ovata]
MKKHSTTKRRHVPLLQLLDERQQALGESVEHGVRGVGECCRSECLDGRLEFREHSGDLVGEVFLRGQVGEEGGEMGVDDGDSGGLGILSGINCCWGCRRCHDFNLSIC